MLTWSVRNKMKKLNNRKNKRSMQKTKSLMNWQAPLSTSNQFKRSPKTRMKMKKKAKLNHPSLNSNKCKQRSK